MAQAQVVAKVSVLSGQAFARDEAGNSRRLKLGDAIREGESVVAADGARLILSLADGRELAVRSGETARLDAEVVAQELPDAADSAVSNNQQGFQKVVQALKSGSDLDALLDEEAPAAGLAGQGGNEGHTFIELLRIVETVDPLAFQFGTNRGVPVESVDGAPVLSGSVGDPVIDIPDTNNPGAGDGDKTVAETDGAIAGSFTLDAPAGLGSLSVGGESFSAAQLADPVYLAAHPIATGEGQLVITGYNPTTGVVSYTYDPAVQTHNGDVLDAIPVVVTDVLGQSTPDSLDITITDSVPVDQNDSNAVTEDTALVASGNVLVGSGADTVGADANATPVTPATVALSYGNLVLNADGSYTYTLNNANPAVNALNNGQSLTDSYTYTLTDGDGSSTPATLTITINGPTDGVPTLDTPDSNNPGGAAGDTR